MTDTTSAEAAPTAPSDPRRLQPLSITWTRDRLIGQVNIDGVLWCAVEWSEKRQAWCIEDAEGACLRHNTSIHGKAAAKKDAVALAFEMIRNGRMPSPEEAREARKAHLEKRRNQPAQVRRREQKMREDTAETELSRAAWDAEWKEKTELPLYEVLSDVFDFDDPELWKSNSFAALRPRLVVHVRGVVAGLEYKFAYEARKANTQPFALWGPTKEQRKAALEHRRSAGEEICRGIQVKLDRARKILRALENDSV